MVGNQQLALLTAFSSVTIVFVAVYEFELDNIQVLKILLHVISKKKNKIFVFIILSQSIINCYFADMTFHYSFPFLTLAVWAFAFLTHICAILYKITSALYFIKRCCHSSNILVKFCRKKYHTVVCLSCLAASCWSMR